MSPLQIDAGTGTFVIYWVVFLIIAPILLGITRDLAAAEKKTKIEE
mgnify:CR=1 FL=1